MAAAQTLSNITCEDQIFDIKFHSKQSIIAAGLVNGNIEIWNYGNQQSQQQKPTRITKYHLFEQSCRGISYNSNGDMLYAISSDKSWHILDSNTGQSVISKKSAHSHAINKLHLIDDNVFSTGDDEGIVKLWDRRQCSNSSSSSKQEIMSWDAHSDYITDFLYCSSYSQLFSTSGDCTLSVYDIRNQAHFYKSDDQESELHCLLMMKDNTRVYCGTQEGAIVIFKYNEWKDCSDRFLGHQNSAGASGGDNCGVECMCKVDEVTMITGSSDSSIRLMSCHPKHKIEGIIGDLNGNSVEGMQLDHKREDGRNQSLLATISNDEIIRFWDLTDILDNIDSDEDQHDEGIEEEGEEHRQGNNGAEDGHDDSVSEDENDSDDDEEGDEESSDEGSDDDGESDNDSGLEANEGNIEIVDAEEEQADEEDDAEENQSDQAAQDNEKESENDSSSSSEEEDRRPKKRIKTAREKFYADL